MKVAGRLRARASAAAAAPGCTNGAGCTAQPRRSSLGLEPVGSRLRVDAQRDAQGGQRIAFLDQAHYSMVKTTTFNGIQLPSIAIWNSETDALHMVKQFDYADFEGRLS